MPYQIEPGATSQSMDVWIDSSATPGEGLTGLVYNTSGLTCYYRRGATGTFTALSLADLVTPAIGDPWLSGGFLEVDATNAPGLYRLDLSDAIVAAGVDWATLVLSGAANMLPCKIRIELRVKQTGDCYAIANSGTHGNAALKTLIDDVPTTAEFEARSIAAASYFDPAADTVANVTTVATLTGHTAQTGDSYARLGAPNAASVAADIAALNDLSAAEVNAEVDTALGTTTQTLPGQGDPTVTPTIVQMVGYLYKQWRNKSTQTDTLNELYADDGTTVDQKFSIAESAATTTKGEVGTGP